MAETRDRQDRRQDMTFNITNASLISSLSTFVAEAIAAERESNSLRITVTDADMIHIKNTVLADLDDVDAAAVAAKISVCDIAELIDPSDIASKIDAADVAEHIDTDRIVDALDVDTIKESIASQISPRMIAREIDSSDIADTIAQSLDLADLAQHIDASDLAQYIDADSSEIASNLYEDESFVEKVARKINVSGAANDHATVEARSAATLAMIDARIADAFTQQIDARISKVFALQIDARMAAAAADIAEQVTQRVLAQIGNTLVALLSGGAKPQ